MIVFDLVCDAAHVFEAWFGSNADYEAQQARGLVSCPVCGRETVTKAAMAPAVPVKANSRAIVPQGAGAVPMQGGMSDPRQMKAMMAALAKAQAAALEGSEHVGPRFAEEARAIHDGTAEQRQIHGHATAAEARALIDDGVPVAPLPFPVRPPDQLQ